MRPLIGITSSFERTTGPAARERSFLNAAYSDAVYAAGGLPFPIVPPPNADEAVFADLLARCDALVFSGGPDLSPARYGQRRHEKTEVLHPRRDAFDIALFQHAERADVPTLSICLGCQIANVACGGMLVQHVDDLTRTNSVQHYKPDHTSAYHPVRVEADSLIAKLVGRTSFEVNSRHHQLVDRAAIGGGLRPVAFAPDGVVEALEDSRRRFFIAVQWHPEDLIDRCEHLALFEGLVRATSSHVERPRDAKNPAEGPNSRYPFRTSCIP